VSTSPGGRDLNYLSHVLSTLPAAVVVVDAVGQVAFASGRAEELIGRPAAELIGRSVLEFVSAETAWAYAAAVAMATDYEDELMGPLRVTLVDGDGHDVGAELWAISRLDDPELAGITCIITPTSADILLTEVAARIAQSDPLEAIATRICEAMHGNPVIADAGVFVEAGGFFRPFGTATLGAATLDILTSGPATVLSDAYEQGVRQLVGDLDDIDTITAGALRGNGYNSLWVEPAGEPGQRTDAVLVTARSFAGNPSPNELSRLYQAASLLALAFRLDRAEA
jgi:PAS domain S-box-containing protein